MAESASRNSTSCGTLMGPAEQVSSSPSSSGTIRSQPHSHGLSPLGMRPEPSRCPGSRYG